MSTREHLDAGIDAYHALIRRDPALAAELEGSVAEFFRGAPPTGSPAAALLSARRHLEWFVFERHSPRLFGTPLERLLEEWRGAARDPEPELERALLQSITGVFEVSDVRRGEGAWLRDLTGFGEHPLGDPALAERLVLGDLLVGRLFPVEDGLFAASRAAGVFRSPGLREALERDLAHAREGGGRQVLRLAQRELERMFWGAGRVTAPTDPLEDARALLREAGFDRARVERTLARLASTPFQVGRLMHGAVDVLGDLLDELAFETRIDLARARSILTHAWAASSAPADVPTARPTEGARDARAAVDAFAAGRAAGGDLDALLGALERDLGLEGEDEDEADSPAPDFPGVVGAMIEEFRWEVGRLEGEAAAARHAPLAQLATYAAHIGVFEELDALHLLRFTCFWLHEREALADGAAALALVDSLEAFCGWVEENHEHPLASGFQRVLEGLVQSLPRVVTLNRRVARAPSDDPGELYAVTRTSARGDVLCDRRGEEHHVTLPSALRTDLRGGDRLRGRIALDGAVTVYRVYPPEAAGLTAG